MLGSNLKVHFAGADNSLAHFISKQIAEVHYSLFSCYPFIKNKNVDSDFTPKTGKLFVPAMLQKDHMTNHVIMDSGLFTLMFGADKGKKQTRESLIEWQDKTANFVNQNKLSCTCVEIDCQKVLGVEEAWFFRERMKRVMPNNRHLNVFHLEDGMKGLDRLIEFSDYIAFSIPELRIHRRGDYKKVTQYLTNYAKNKKPTIDIHLLGCTEFEMLKQNKFCTSADSTSWLAASRFGRIAGQYHVSQVRDSAMQNLDSEVRSKCKQFGFDSTEKQIIIIKHAAISAMLEKNKYVKACGDQD